MDYVGPQCNSKLLYLYLLLIDKPKLSHSMSRYPCDLVRRTS